MCPLQQTRLSTSTEKRTKTDCGERVEIHDYRHSSPARTVEQIHNTRLSYLESDYKVFHDNCNGTAGFRSDPSFPKSAQRRWAECFVGIKSRVSGRKL